MIEKSGRIEIHVGSIKQLFNSFDPSPFLEKDLDQEAERFVVAWASELDPKVPITLAIYFTDSLATSHEAQFIPHAFKNYFNYKASQAMLEIHELLRIGWRSLAVGSLVLLGSLLASNFISNTWGASPFGALLAESFVILGWVANWRPLEIFLYGWWPIARKRRLFLRLSIASIEIHDNHVALSGNSTETTRKFYRRRQESQSSTTVAAEECK
jgi:hypothetical protein